MFRISYVIYLAITLWLFLSSCETDSPVSPDLPDTGSPLSAQIVDLSDDLSGREGSLNLSAFDAAVSNDSGVAVPGAPVRIWVESGPGETAAELSRTDSAGLVHAVYYVVLGYGDTTSVIAVSAGYDTAYATITLHGDPAPASIELTASPEDYNLHYLSRRRGELMVTVLDSRLNGVPDQDVALEVLDGDLELQNFARTNGSGVVLLWIEPHGDWFGDLTIAATCVDATQPLSARNFALLKQLPFIVDVDRGVISDTLVIPVTLASAVGLQFLTPDTSIGQYTGIDRIELSAQLMDADSNPISRVAVEFHSELTGTRAVLTDAEGIARLELRLPDEPGTIPVRVEYAPLGLADTVAVTRFERRPADFDLEFHPQTDVFWVDSTYVMEYTILATDGMPVVGVGMSLSASSGQIEDGFDVTDAGGRCWFTYIPRSSGSATLMVGLHTDPPLTGQTTILILGGNPNSIELTADPLEIQVAGTGGIESTTLTATVRDANGNRVGDDIPVYFELLRQPPEPRGCNLNGHGQLDSAFTSDGIARAILNSGTQSGGVLIKAYTWRDPETRQELVQVVNSTAQVVAGPPEFIDADFNIDPEGVDLGDTLWALRTEISTRIYDTYRNPVYELQDLSFSIWPDVARFEEIERRTYLVFHSRHTFTPVTLTPIVETDDGRRTGDATLFTLPLQEGTLSLNIDPVNIMLEDPEQLIHVTCLTELIDGHNYPINNAPILYTASRGRLWWRDARDSSYVEFEDEAIQHTGWRAPEHPEHEEEDGQATVYLRGVMDDFFLDPFTLEVTVQISAEVVGYDDVVADPAFVFITRH